MLYKEIHIKNPITIKSVNQLIDDIKTCDTSLLIINIGEHNFESVDVMKELKNRLTAEIKSQGHIRKIAFLISGSPKYSAIHAPDKMAAVGFTLSIPLYFGALPCAGSNIA